MSRVAAAFLVALSLGCTPLEADRRDYIGDWRAPGMYVRINEHGQVRYWRQTKGIKNSFNAPIKRFEGNNFVVGFGPIATTFVVSKPPHLDKGVWKMTVDGVELVRERYSGVSA